MRMKKGMTFYDQEDGVHFMRAVDGLEIHTQDRNDKRVQVRIYVG